MEKSFDFGPDNFIMSLAAATVFSGVSTRTDVGFLSEGCDPWMAQGVGMSTETSYDTLFGRMAVDQGLCTDDELRRAIQEYKERRKTDPLMLQDLMVQLGYITTSQAERLQTSIKESKAAATQIPGYKILGKLGAGAMAVVYKGKQLSLNRSVAIKVLPGASARAPSTSSGSTRRVRPPASSTTEHRPGHRRRGSGRLPLLRDGVCRGQDDRR